MVGVGKLTIWSSADPADWEALASAEAKTNPRLRADYGRLDLVPPGRRVGGPGASCLMAPFVHVSTDRPGRFTDGSHGVYSAGNRAEVALREVAHHHGRAMAATDETPGWTSRFRQLIGHIDRELHDLSAVSEVLAPDDHGPGQALGRALRAAGSDGVHYPSVRCPGGQCIGVFWPDVPPVPIQGTHCDFHWDGQRVDRVRDRGSGRLFAL
ncbi:RES family NAD+ phosphorylase [Roseospirillum parvum]|uniref:RES family NAD+ phosphorylase n=1 Tax=Roseospirillum parvum TaxID=83401 RepID=UPI001FE0397D|nr:RES family NAD+ phosphorylase [Roseospirillum parvum]